MLQIRCLLEKSFYNAHRNAIEIGQIFSFFFFKSVNSRLLLLVRLINSLIPIQMDRHLILIIFCTRYNLRVSTCSMPNSVSSVLLYNFMSLLIGSFSTAEAFLPRAFDFCWVLLFSRFPWRFISFRQYKGTHCCKYSAVDFHCILRGIAIGKDSHRAGRDTNTLSWCCNSTFDS